MSRGLYRHCCAHALSGVEWSSISSRFIFTRWKKKKRNTREQAGTYMLSRFALVTRAILQIFIAEIFSSQSRKLLFLPRNRWSAIWLKFCENLNYWQVFQEEQARFDKSETWWRIWGICLSKRVRIFHLRSKWYKDINSLLCFVSSASN